MYELFLFKSLFWRIKERNYVNHILAEFFTLIKSAIIFSKQELTVAKYVYALLEFSKNCIILRLYPCKKHNTLLELEN